jgi:hypothetical protein
MLAAKHTKLLDNSSTASERWGDFLVSAWVLFIAFALCGVITLAGFPVGWKEATTDYSAAAASAQSAGGAALEASALRPVAR